MSFDNIFNDIKQQIMLFSYNSILEVIIYLAAGFVTGFLVKHLGRYILLLLISVAISVWILEYFSFISINYNYIQEFSSLFANNSLLNQISVWMSNHIPQCIALSLGFYLSLELL